MPETRVVLRRWPAREGGEIIALFPDHPEPNGCMLSYMHVGQHSAASPRVVGWTRPVDPSDDDAQALVRELTAIGYRVRLVRRLRGAR